MGDLADHFFRGGIGDRQRLAADGVTPCAVDEKLDVGIGMHGIAPSYFEAAAGYGADRISALARSGRRTDGGADTKRDG
ncbi:MAG: hypothetical protein ACK4QP_07270 [Pseudorhizobium sp.]